VPSSKATPIRAGSRVDVGRISIKCHGVPLGSMTARVKLMTAAFNVKADGMERVWHGPCVQDELHRLVVPCSCCIWSTGSPWRELLTILRPRQPILPTTPAAAEPIELGRRYLIT